MSLVTAKGTTERGKQTYIFFQITHINYSINTKQQVYVYKINVYATLTNNIYIYTFYFILQTRRVLSLTTANTVNIDANITYYLTLQPGHLYFMACSLHTPHICILTKGKETL